MFIYSIQQAYNSPLVETGFLAKLYKEIKSANE